LTTLKGFTDLIVNEELEFEKGKNYLKLVSGRVDNLLIFLNDLMNWSKRQIDQLPPQLVKFNAVEVLKQVLALYDKQVKDKKLEVKLKDSDIEIFSDKERYSFVIRNIIHNAIKFSNTGGVISIEIKELDKEKHTIISDNGAGLSKENIDKVLNKEGFLQQMEL